MEQALRFRGRDMALKPRIFSRVDPILIVPLMGVLILHFAIIQFLMLIVMFVIVVSDVAGVSPAEFWRMIVRRTRANHNVVICRTSARSRYKNLLNKGIIRE
ncbi:hypothetical protein GCM10010995_06930 [Cysteiniphilum litorale]|uniref:Uncharacterized protein n=2 Tax=Fastidiosibacteraceae TaxID=2056687 RepID=A0A8J2Z2Z1_9GAMM|nr:hypothetical protein GCM10010995_06930 [Cysteiniphilum litorale]